MNVFGLVELILILRDGKIECDCLLLYVPVNLPPIRENCTVDLFPTVGEVRSRKNSLGFLFADQMASVSINCSIFEIFLYIQNSSKEKVIWTFF